MVGVVAALPAGWLADFTRRDYLLKACGSTSLGTYCPSILALYLAPYQAFSKTGAQHSMHQGLLLISLSVIQC
jgi:hypothetical protein